MDRHDVLRRISEVGVIPVVRAASSEEAIQVIEALQLGGLSILEITMTVPGAVSVIEEVANRYGDKVVVGAGTVLDPDTARACMLAGASFIVSPSLNIQTIELCRRDSIPVFPGALTPTEVVTAWQAGADAVKVFPCGAVGGAKYLASLKAPLPQVEMIPTGGVSLATAADFIAAGAFALGVGTDLVDLSAIRSGQPEKVAAATRAYIAAVAQARGVNLSEPPA
ncbi:MAG TPA: bifunctional 4-hydroxy-2-oxoglutarate aldolase/2-dehydro-3-deoxy-phosphogluconate aldolase [Pyrinomonadaceae bacterium]|nr:bifunctional 4-hydroxy-2-oxoglutarate aldolase/2-dehydro-3-deoxy-phosphogluconate aldolase [Pyrinomonadaceae bacterium]